jgi:hypothetical protein
MTRPTPTPLSGGHTQRKKTETVRLKRVISGRQPRWGWTSSQSRWMYAGRNATFNSLYIPLGLLDT